MGLSLLLTYPKLNSQAQLGKSEWVDSVMKTMSIDEKIGQLFMIRAFSKDDPDHIKNVKNQIKKYKVAGLCFFQGDPTRQLELIKEYQAIAKIPLMTAIDGEWGLGMRFPDQAISFPRQLTIGAINDHQLIFRMGKEVGRQLNLTGLNINFAPSVDVNNNPANPVINFRSFGEDRYNVSTKAYAYMYGMMQSGIMPCAKHFPGHGDTDVDSHYDLPVIPHSRHRLDSLELFPFKMMISYGVPSIMVAHLQVPALDARKNRPTTVSRSVVTDLLRNELGFQGLIMTDAMEMKGVTKHFGPGKADLEAFLAGNDMILLPEDMEQGFNAIKKTYELGDLSLERIEESVRRVLEGKYDLNLNQPLNYPTSDLSKELNSIEAKVIKAKIYEKALTLVANDQNILPIKELTKQSYGSISLGANSITSFQVRLNSYIDCEHHQLLKKSSRDSYQEKLRALEKKDLVFIGVHDMSWYSTKGFGIDSAQISFIYRLASKTKVVLTLFGSPYALKYFEQIPNVLVAYEDGEMPQDAAAQALMGASDITGKLPVTTGIKYRVGAGIMLPGLSRMGYALPEAVGMSSDSLLQIDQIVKEMIDEKAAPGCQILIARNNKVIFWKSYGNKTYEDNAPIQNNDLFDVASITKILATTISLMRLQDQGKFNPYSPLGAYIPALDSTNKSTMICEDVLAHVSGLIGWIPFYQNTLNDGKDPSLNPKYYSKVKKEGFEVEVTSKLFMRNDYRDSIWQAIFSSDRRSSNDYRYSDLGFYMFNKIVNNLSGLEVDQYAEAQFYNPLGLRRTLFNPLKRMKSHEIVPSEKDEYFRQEVLCGSVHDMGAAMLGGVSGHAGLFSNAMELGILMQMLLNKGYYGGTQYLQASTIEKYTQRHWKSTRRGLGFDLKELNPKKSMNMSEAASSLTFGHLGFTGTVVFADPKEDLVFIFLANRTYPSMNNNKFGSHEYRPRVQTAAYNAIIK